MISLPVIFVDRETELRVLDRLFRARLRGANYYVLIYGIRRVGKTSLVDRFLVGKVGFRVDCSSIVTGGDFFRAIYSNLRNLEVSERFYDVLENYAGLYQRPLDDDFQMVKHSFDLLNNCADKIEYIIVALDEFHAFIENVSTLRFRGGDLAKERLLWFLRDNIQRLRENIFLIILTSAGFLFEEYGKADKAFLQLLQKVEVKPLTEEASMEMARRLLQAMNISYSYEALNTIAKLSGGVPKLIEEIVGYISARDNVTSADVIDAVEEALNAGFFDDFFEAYFSFLAETTKWSKATLVKVLRALAEEIKSPKEISRETGIRYHTLLNILSDLRKKGIVSRELGINYPLLKEWLLARELPPSGIKRVDLLRQSLGITIEYYVRELFRHINRKIVLEGEQFFIGTAKKISLGPIDNVSGGGEIDLIAHQTDCLTWVGEIKIGKVSKGDLMKFLERVRRIKERKVCIVIASDADPLALAEMVRNGVIFMQLKTLNEMAKKVGFPKINLPQ